MERQFFAGLAMVVCLAYGAQASLVNPSFETGDLAGWTTVSSGGYGSGSSVVDNVANQAVQ